MDPVLEQRWQALDKTIDILSTWLQPPQEPEDPSYTCRRHLLYCLLARLKTFAAGQCDLFFNQLFSGKSLVQSQEYPPEHVLKTVLDQIADDLDIIRRAAADEVISYEVSSKGENGEPINAEMAIALLRGDFLVLEALGPAIAALGIENPIPLTYFQKSAAARIIPYDADSWALIGLPFTSIQVYQDFLATPHEVGHFVYWSGKKNGDNMWEVVRDAIDDPENKVPRWMKPWTEEIFADIYGCMLAGPIIAFSFQDLQLLESNIGFVTDDREHPTPLVRPYVYSETISLMENENPSESNNWAEALAAHWNARLEEISRDFDHILLQQSLTLGYTDTSLDEFEEFYGYHHISQPRAVAEIKKMVCIIYPILKEAFDYLDASQVAPNWWWIIKNTYLGSDPSNIIPSGDVYYQFTQHVANGKEDLLENLHITSSDRECTTDFEWQTWAEEKIAEAASNGIASATSTPEDKISIEKWQKIWIADGWATRGPTRNWG